MKTLPVHTGGWPCWPFHHPHRVASQQGLCRAPVALRLCMVCVPKASAHCFSVALPSKPLTLDEATVHSLYS